LLKSTVAGTPIEETNAVCSFLREDIVFFFDCLLQLPGSCSTSAKPHFRDKPSSPSISNARADPQVNTCICELQRLARKMQIPSGRNADQAVQAKRRGLHREVNSVWRLVF
jgi:hypothetical protein